MNFPKRIMREKSEMYVEDKEFMNLTTKAIAVKERYYYLPPPFRDKDVLLPNNHDVAAQRTVSQGDSGRIRLLRLSTKHSWRMYCKRAMQKKCNKNSCQKILTTFH